MGNKGRTSDHCIYRDHDCLLCDHGGNFLRQRCAVQRGIFRDRGSNAVLPDSDVYFKMEIKNKRR